MIYSLPPDAEAPSAAAFTDLREYIEHKIGMTIEEIKADSPERFRVIEEEAVRDIVVMSEITGEDRTLRLLPGTLDNPECKRLLGSWQCQDN